MQTKIVSYSVQNTRIWSRHMRNTYAQDNQGYLERMACVQTIQKELIRGHKSFGRLAMILGAGRCNDIPLFDLAKGFEKVYLVDLLGADSKKAVLDLPVGLQDKCSVVSADLSIYSEAGYRLISAEVAGIVNYLSSAHNLNHAERYSKTDQAIRKCLEILFTTAKKESPLAALPKAELLVMSKFLYLAHFLPIEKLILMPIAKVEQSMINKPVSERYYQALDQGLKKILGLALERLIASLLPGGFLLYQEIDFAKGAEGLDDVLNKNFKQIQRGQFQELRLELWKKGWQ